MYESTSLWCCSRQFNEQVIGGGLLGAMLRFFKGPLPGQWPLLHKQPPIGLLAIFRFLYGQHTHAELAATTANNFSDSCQANDERVTQDESVFLNHNPVLKLITIGSLRRAFILIMQDPGIEAMRAGKTWIRQYRTYRSYATRY